MITIFRRSTHITHTLSRAYEKTTNWFHPFYMNKSWLAVHSSLLQKEWHTWHRNCRDAIAKGTPSTENCECNYVKSRNDNVESTASQKSIKPKKQHQSFFSFCTHTHKIHRLTLFQRSVKKKNIQTMDERKKNNDNCCKAIIRNVLGAM